MLIHKLLAAVAISLLTFPLTVSSASSRPAVTAREHQLAAAVEQIATGYYDQYEQALPVNGDSLSAVMEALGADPSEAGFVYDRMQAYSEATEAIHRTDRLINRMQNFLGCLNTQGTGCVP